ncbi:DUF461 domain-containing protein [Streptomyces sp. ICN441]|uniref:DUF461 domain-containing protein n=1 Tax=Streptomyces tirandamycinicus TaxID=2174846 RepID=A0A2S1STS0_9ACTN|nr:MULTISPECIES: DUF461 domain-containing protein [Streptomyces]AWI29792.1 DUF461 domain-containing protein [Streptomyces tirandamycinicus]TFE54217.1 DUF461 domain-containing protein [Streptomyces sp. ICN441]
MSSSLRRGALAATALLIPIATLSACAAGNDAQTLGVRPDNPETSVGDIKIQNATVITQPQPGVQGQATVSATLFNDGTQEQTLDSVTLPGTQSAVKLTPATGSGPITVAPGGSVVLGGKGNPSGIIENSAEAGRLGDVQRIVFRFSETGDVPIDAFVVPAADYYRDYGPSNLPQPPAASPTGSAPAQDGAHGDEAGHGDEAEGGDHGAPEDGEHGGEPTPSDSASASQDAGH